MSDIYIQPGSGGSGSGSVTSVGPGTGISTSPNPITTTGTVALAAISNDTVLGNISGSSAAPSALTATQLTTIPNVATASLQGMLPALTDAQIVVGKTASNVQAVTMTGNVTISDTGVTTIATSVALAGNPTTTTQSAGDNSTKISTTAFVTTAVNNAIAGVNPAVAVQAATAAILPNSPIYNNGASGIGATIISGTNSVLVVDGYTPSLNDRILVKNEASGGGLGGADNGIYTITQLGVAGITPWIMTRALDFDTSSDMNSTGAIPVYNGTANATTLWVLTSTITTVGMDVLVFTQFGTGGGGSGITGLTGDIITALSTSGNVASFNFGQTQLITPTLTTSQNNWSPTGWLTTGVQVANQIRITNATSILSITGLVPQTSGPEGSTVTIGVASASTQFPIKLVANSASSTAANQFGFSGDVFIAPGEEVTLMYDATASLWREKYGRKDWGQVYFGSGADGDTTISGTTTLARDMYYRNLTISGAGNKIITNTFRIYVSEVLDISGAIAGGIQLNGGAGGNGTGGGAAGSAGTRVFSGAVQLPIMTGGLVGATGTSTNGNNGTAGTAGAITGQNSLAGGVGGTGAGGTAGNGGGAASSGSNNGIVTAFNTQPYQDLASVAMNILSIGCSGGSGGGGSGDTANAGGGGGGSGCSGGIVWVSARFINRGSSSTASIIQALGGNGGNGGSPGTGTPGGGGGGSAGGGGVIQLYYGYLLGSVITGALDVTGGTGGTGGTSPSTATGGHGGGSGGSGIIAAINVVSGVSTTTTGVAAVAGSAASGVTGGAGGTPTTKQQNL